MKKVKGFTQEESFKMYIAQVERAQRTKKALPYFILSRGPALNPCPVHRKNEGLVLPVDDLYWIDFPMRKQPECKCRVRGLSIREYERIKQQGTQDPDAPQTLDEKGNPTGLKEKRYIPIKEKPIL